MTSHMLAAAHDNAKMDAGDKKPCPTRPLLWHQARQGPLWLGRPCHCQVCFVLSHIRHSVTRQLTLVSSLHGVSNHPVSTPLVINLPAYPTQDIADVDSYLPSFLRPYPAATIHYRWSNSRDTEAAHPPPPPHNHDDHHPHDVVRPIPTSLQWPTPLADTLAAFDFLRQTLAPPAAQGRGALKRDLYVHSSYLGASLAASLALTESHVHEPVTIRGLSAYNGIYNWTTFLPDYPARRRLRASETLRDLYYDIADDEDVAHLRHLLPTLFRAPANLFDPFVSPVLLFHTSGLMVPPSFTERWTPPHLSPRKLGGDIDPYDYVYSDPEDPPPPEPYPEVAEMEAERGEEEDLGTSDDTSTDSRTSLSDKASSNPSTSSSLASATTSKATGHPRRGYLTFPPRDSNLKIPHTLLLHSTPPPLPQLPSHVVSKFQQPVLWKMIKNAENSFGAHALALGSLMRRSVDKIELRDRMKWDHDFDNWDGEAAKRVRIEDAGGGRVDWESADSGVGNGDRAEEMAAQWYEERMF